MMFKLAFGVFLILHGLVHLLYFGQSRRIFALQTGLDWPENSWALSPFLGGGGACRAGAIGCVLLAVGFAAGGVALLAGWPRWRLLVVASAILSIFIFLLLWDGHFRRLDDQGGINLLLNAALLAALLLPEGPSGW